jgi:hypothetical protein
VIRLFILDPVVAAIRTAQALRILSSIATVPTGVVAAG